MEERKNTFTGIRMQLGGQIGKISCRFRVEIHDGFQAEAGVAADEIIECAEQEEKPKRMNMSVTPSFQVVDGKLPGAPQEKE